MAKKVTLDILDVEEFALSHQDKSREIETIETEAKKPSGRWFVSRRLLLSSVIVIALLAIGGGLSYWLGGTNKTVRSAPAGKSMQAAPLPAQYAMAVLNDFLITLRDDEGKERAIVCDLTIELHDNRYQSLIRNDLVEAGNQYGNG